MKDRIRVASPVVRAEVRKELEYCNNKLNSFGPAIDTVARQLQLTGIVNEMDSLLKDAIKGFYSAEYRFAWNSAF